jgi:hypothetical protein
MRQNDRARERRAGETGADPRDERRGALTGKAPELAEHGQAVRAGTPGGGSGNSAQHERVRLDDVLALHGRERPAANVDDRPSRAGLLDDTNRLAGSRERIASAVDHLQRPEAEQQHAERANCERRENGDTRDEARPSEVAGIHFRQRPDEPERRWRKLSAGRPVSRRPRPRRAPRCPLLAHGLRSRGEVERRPRPPPPSVAALPSRLNGIEKRQPQPTVERVDLDHVVDRHGGAARPQRPLLDDEEVGSIEPRAEQHCLDMAPPPGRVHTEAATTAQPVVAPEADEPRQLDRPVGRRCRRVFRAVRRHHPPPACAFDRRASIHRPNDPRAEVAGPTGGGYASFSCRFPAGSSSTASGSFGARRSSVSQRTAAVAYALTQLRSAGTTCHGAQSLEVSVSAAS